MKPQTNVVIEHMTLRLSKLVAIAEAAEHQAVNLIAIIPSTLSPHERAELSFRTRCTSDWSTANLEAALRRIEETEQIVGIGTYIGFFNTTGLLSVQVATLCALRGLPHPPIDALYRADNKFVMRRTQHLHRALCTRQGQCEPDKGCRTCWVSADFKTRCGHGFKLHITL